MNGRLVLPALIAVLVIAAPGWPGLQECRADLTIADIVKPVDQGGMGGMLTAGNLTFTFTANSVTSDPNYGTFFVAPTAATVDVTVLGGGPTFTFNPMLNLTTADEITRTITISYSVAATPGIAAAGLSFSGLANDPTTSSVVTETLAEPNETLTVSTMQDGTGKVTGQNNQTVGFPVQQTLTVTNTGVLSTPVRGNGATSTAQLTSITNTFSVAPEPSSFVVVSFAAMVGLGAWWRSRQRIAA